MDLFFLKNPSQFPFAKGGSFHRHASGKRSAQKFLILSASNIHRRKSDGKTYDTSREFPCKEIIANNDIYAILLIEIGATMGIKPNSH